MKRLILIFVSIALSGPALCAQGVKNQKSSRDDELSEAQVMWLSDLRVIEGESSKLEGLARALAKAEIAAAAWDLDNRWSKELLRVAYELTFPSEREQTKLRERAVGSKPSPPTYADRARNAVSRRVLQVASRDGIFAQELVQMGMEKLGNYEAHLKYTTLAAQAFGEGDKENTRKFLLQAMDADPTQITAGLMIRDIGAQDRAFADNLTLQYIERLRNFPLSNANQSLGRAFFILSTLASPQTSPAPSAAVMRAYLNFVLQSLTTLANDPAYLQAASPILISTWPLVRQYAPDLTEAFLALEQRSRRSSTYGSPAETVDEMYRASQSRSDQLIAKALESEEPDEAIIRLAISRGDFDKARKMIDKLDDEHQKTKLIELVNVREALSRAAKDDIAGALTLAERLKDATSIVPVYSAIINKCLASKNQASLNESVVQAIKQIKLADNRLPAPPVGLPSSSVAGDGEIDLVLIGLSKFAKAIAPVNESLAWDILDELVLSANRSKLDTSQGRTGFEGDIFKLMGQKNEARAYQTANNLKDRLERIVALANIYQGLADAYERSSPARGARRSL